MTPRGNSTGCNSLLTISFHSFHRYIKDSNYIVTFNVQTHVHLHYTDTKEFPYKLNMFLSDGFETNFDANGTSFRVQISSERIQIEDHIEDFKLKYNFSFPLNQDLVLTINNALEEKTLMCNKTNLSFLSLAYPLGRLSKGKSYKLSCVALGVPPIQSWWLFNGALVKPDKVIVVTYMKTQYFDVTSTLTVDIDSCGDLGEYTCVMENNFLNQRITHTMVLTNYSRVETQAGQTVIITPEYPTQSMFSIESYNLPESIDVSCLSSSLFAKIIEKGDSCNTINVMVGWNGNMAANFESVCRITLVNNSGTNEYKIEVQFCGGGMYMSGSACKTCPPGQWSDKAHEYKCFFTNSICDEGFYSMNNKCLPCPFGFTSVRHTATMLEHCFSPAKRNCGVGFYGLNGSCFSCPNGTTTYEKGAVKLRDCSCLDKYYRKGNFCFKGFHTIDAIKHPSFLVSLLMNILFLILILLIILRYRKEVTRLYNLQIKRRSEITSLPVSLPIINMSATSRISTLTREAVLQSTSLGLDSEDEDSQSAVDEFIDINSSKENSIYVELEDEEWGDSKQETYAIFFEDEPYEQLNAGDDSFAFDDSENLYSKPFKENKVDAKTSIQAEVGYEEMAMDNLYSKVLKEEMPTCAMDIVSLSDDNGDGSFGNSDEDEFTYATIQTLPSGKKASTHLRVKNK